MGRRKNDRRARNTGGLRQKGANTFEGRLRVRRKDGSFIEKSFTRSTKSECQEIINSLRVYEPLENNIKEIKIDRYTNNITLIKDGEDNNINGDMLFSDYMDYFIWNHRRLGIKNTAIKETTLSSYIDNAKLIKRKIGDRKIADLKYEDIRKALEEIHQDTCDSTAKKVKNLVYSAFKFAKKDKVISVNVLADNDEIHFKESKGKKSRKIIRKEDEQIVIDYCLENKEYMILFILLTGVRESEACGVALNNIDFDNNTVNICQAYMRLDKFEYKDGKIEKVGSKKEITDLKSKSSYRALGLPAEFMEILKEYKEEQKELAVKCGKKFKEEDFVFTTNEYKGYVSDGVIEKLKRIMQNLKIKDYDKITIHGLRHTFCSRGVRNKVTLKEMQRLMGHSSIKVTADIYSQLDDEMVIKASNKVNEDMGAYISNYKNMKKSDKNSEKE